ncbi:hypothetical protein [Virgibacillus ndiopensis]|uniref:hypothetical protein n=1 Tax=Virgibacillus ndiopensis TaxID=2004408 RepID=UPI000C074CF7|nr:hypothetical protein [Virgibacillus ndiopensis]
MKTFLPLLGLILTLVLVAFFDAPNNIKGSDQSNTFYNTDEDTEEVNAQTQENNVPTYSSLVYILEESEEVDGSIIKTFREYEIYVDEEGNVIKKVPTSNYNYLTYKNYEE